MVASWSISDRLLGPRTSAYAGYHRTWYGNLMHLMLWAAYFFMLSTAISKLLPNFTPNTDRRDV
jgi:hypothetical protein